jgi:hypothetical protein
MPSPKTAALNLLSHGKYDIYQPSVMVADNKKLFRQILDAFLRRYESCCLRSLNSPRREEPQRLQHE